METLKQFRKSRVSRIAMDLLIVIIFLAIFADYVAPYTFSEQHPEAAFTSPNIKNLMGTDNFGRDIFSRIIFGARISLKIGFISVIIAGAIGTLIGAFAGYFGNTFDRIVMRIMDIVLSIPSLVLAIAIAASLGNGMKNLIIAVSLSSVPRYARIVRSTVMSLKEKEFIESARVSGASHMRILFVHILPNCIAPIIVEATIGVGTSILSAASLSFIGMGVLPPNPEWGSMLSESRMYFRDYPYMSMFPGLAIAITILLLNIVGDGLRDAMDPKLRRTK